MFGLAMNSLHFTSAHITPVSPLSQKHFTRSHDLEKKGERLLFQDL